MSVILPDNHSWSNDQPTEEELRHGIGEIQRHKHLPLSDFYKALYRYRSNIRTTKAVFRVPNEIWLHIFSQWNPEWPLESLKNRYMTGLVCQRWTQLAETLPEAIIVYVIDPAHAPQNPEILNSKGDTFALRLNLSTDGNAEHANFSKSIEHLSSLSHLSLTYHPKAHGTVNRLIPRHLPHLQTLKLRVPNDLTANESQLAVFNDAHALASVEIESSIHIRVPFPLNNLIRYREISLDPIQFVYSLSAATKLEELSYTIRNPTLAALAGVTRPTIRINT
ncbi:hypothetical protein BJ165DRAFT_180348 [Panaeolus papilionaceus]|nr:hypothetical protein BJ165DRAFT_180348 [Panaeolus papilionaceus]